MELIDWEFTRRRGIKAIFNHFPNSIVTFRLINRYYFVYNVEWSKNDQVVTSADLSEMSMILNNELGLKDEYSQRKSNIKSFNR